MRTINVAIYNGINSGQNSPVGIKKALEQANKDKWFKDIQFKIKNIQSITKTTMKDMEILVMPGGDSGERYLKNPKINGDVIKAHVKAGGGFIGICAGAYAGCNKLDDSTIRKGYKGWGVAPNTNCKISTHDGIAPIQFRSHDGEKIGYSGVKKLIHLAGPAMYRIDKTKNTVFAVFSDGTLGYRNYGAIMSDRFGKGKSILVSPHPELNPTDYKLVAKLVWWVRKA